MGGGRETEFIWSGLICVPTDTEGILSILKHVLYSSIMQLNVCVCARACVRACVRAVCVCSCVCKMV